MKKTDQVKICLLASGFSNEERNALLAGQEVAAHLDGGPFSIYKLNEDMSGYTEQYGCGSFNKYYHEFDFSIC